MKELKRKEREIKLKLEEEEPALREKELLLKLKEKELERREKKLALKAKEMELVKREEEVRKNDAKEPQDEVQRSRETARNSALEREVNRLKRKIDMWEREYEYERKKARDG